MDYHTLQLLRAAKKAKMALTFNNSTEAFQTLAKAEALVLLDCADVVTAAENFERAVYDIIRNWFPGSQPPEINKAMDLVIPRFPVPFWAEFDTPDSRQSKVREIHTVLLVEFPTHSYGWLEAAGEIVAAFPYHDAHPAPPAETPGAPV